MFENASKTRLRQIFLACHSSTVQVLISTSRKGPSCWLIVMSLSDSVFTSMVDTAEVV